MLPDAYNFLLLYIPSVTAHEINGKLKVQSLRQWYLKPQVSSMIKSRYIRSYKFLSDKMICICDATSAFSH